MRRRLGHLTWGVSFGVLLTAIGVGEVKADPAYTISITIRDNTTGVTTPFSIPQTSPLNTSTNPNQIVVSAAFNTSATGVSITGLQSTSMATAASSQLGIQGTVTLNPGTSDNYTITINTTRDGFTTPPVNVIGILSQSESGTYTFTGTGGTQSFISWYSPVGTATPPVTSGSTPGLQNIAIPATGMATLSGNANTPGSVAFSPYVTPYTLANQIVINITGNGTQNNSIVGFQGSTTLMAVPEPASLVMVLTGMPVPLMVLGILRRRKAQRKMDLAA